MRRRPFVRGLALATVVGAAVAAVAALATAPQAAASAAVERCPGSGPLVVNAYATFRNEADFGADGHAGPSTRDARRSRSGKSGRIPTA